MYIFFIFYHVFVFIKPKNLNLKVIHEKVMVDLHEVWERWCFWKSVTFATLMSLFINLRAFLLSHIQYLWQGLFQPYVRQTCHRFKKKNDYRVHVSFETKEKVLSQDTSPMRVLNSGSAFTRLSEPENFRG